STIGSDCSESLDTLKIVISMAVRNSAALDSDRALIQCSRRGLSRQIYIGSYCHGRFTWVHRTCSANEVSKKVPFPCWVSVASIGHNRANAISENEPSSEPECESDCEVRHHITLTPD